MEPTYVHVSLGQFESTAIQKLVSRGIREDVARAFVTEGLRKQNGYDRYKEIVCKAKFHSFFVHKPEEGAMVPTVLERKTNKFKAPYAMTGREKADLMSSFPELDVSCDGIIRNSHAFYANKRLAECELLISLVWSTALSDGTLDPRSVVDLGGNQVQHINRGRDNVHCDTPVLSAKDIYRYTVREVYSGVDPETACRLSFHSCNVRADFAIGVHSTYDLTPQSIAEGMARRGMRWFFGVVNVHPNLVGLASGEYIHDGMVLKVTSDTIGYSFVHDTSLVYTHSKSTMSQYLRASMSLKVNTESGPKFYLFKHHSVRGATIVFSISEHNALPVLGTSIATGMRANKYRIKLQNTELPIEVDREMFDRLVLMAAASRKIEEYNITALFKYAKSLRQRISINSIVLSAGFKEDTGVLVKITVAAMAVASAYHLESARFFKAQTRELMLRRDKSIVSQLFNISSSLVKLSVDTISDLVGFSSTFELLKSWSNSILKKGNSVQVEVATVKDFGCRFEPQILGPTKVQMGKPSDAEWFTNVAVDFPDKELNWSRMYYTTIHDSDFPGHSNFKVSCLAGYGYRSSYPRELAIEKCVSKPGVVSGVSPMLLRASSDRHSVYKAWVNQYDFQGEINGKPRNLSNGDSIIHVLARDPDDISIPVQHCYFAMRGLGSKFVLCKPPSFYTSRCLAFVLFYEHDITEIVHDAAAGSQSPEELPNPLYSVVRHCVAHVQHLGQTEGIAFSSGESSTSVITKRAFAVGTRFVGVGSRPEIVATPGVLRATQRARMEEVSRQVLEEETGDFLPSSGESDVGSDAGNQSGSECESPTFPTAEEQSGEDSDDDILGPASENMANVSVGSGDDRAFTDPAGGTVHDAVIVRDSRAVLSAPAAVGGGLSDAVSQSTRTGSESATATVIRDDRDSSPDAAGVSSVTDQFVSLLRRGDDQPRRKNWGSDSTSSVSAVPGFPAISELLRWAEESSLFALSVGQRCINFAIGALRDDISERQWHGIKSGLEGDVQICEVNDSGFLVEYYSKDKLPHMAVTDGDRIYVVRSLSPGAGPFITYRELEVWTVDSILAVASRCMFNEYQCPVELIQGPAGCGKTTEICKHIQDGDLGLCETRAAAADTASRLTESKPRVAGSFSTVDSFLINRAQTFTDEVDTVYIDECLRLHAGKIWCIVKIVKPRRVVCYGDPQQIPLLPFTPGFEFENATFPWSSVNTLKRTFRLPADITMMLVTSGYYDYSFKTRNPILHGFKGVKQFYPGMFKDKPEDVTVLTYTKAAAEELRFEGIKPVMTIGESQGKDIDHVWLYRESDLAKDIYYNKEQTLTAITRVKKSFTFIPISPFDDSAIQTLIKLLDDPVASATIADYQIK